MALKQVTSNSEAKFMSNLEAVERPSSEVVMAKNFGVVRFNGLGAVDATPSLVSTYV